MHSRTLFFGIAIVVALAFAPGSVYSQGKESKADAKAKTPTAEEMMKQWMAVAAPGEWHKKLDAFVGSWETSSSMWMEGPDKPPMMSKGTSESRWILGGRFLLQEAKGEMMGQPFEGMGLTGYDNVNKKYVSFWIDNSSTAMFTSDGSVDQAGKVFTSYGKMDDPSTGEHGKNVKYVDRIIDKDKHVLEFYDLASGENAKVGEVVYTRKK